MATITPGGLYTGGAAVFDSQPLANMYQRFTERRMARDEALDDYFRNLNKSINPAGVRNQDIEGLTKKQNEWQQFYQQNKQAIKNPKLDNGKSLSEYQSRYQDMLNYVQQSKNATTVSADLAKARLNPNLGYMFEDDEVIGKIATHDKPLTDPEHQILNIQELSIQPKPLDLKELQALQKSALAGLKPSEEVEDIRIDPVNLDTITTTKKQYSNTDLQTIGNRYKSLYQFDRRLRTTADKSLLNAPNVAELNDVYKSVYGENAETPADLLAAQGILTAQTEGKIEKRTAGSLAQKKLLENMRQANRAAMVDYREKAKREGKAMENLWVQSYIDKVTEDAKGAVGRRIRIGGQDLDEKEISLDPIIAKALKRDKFEPDRVTITADGRIRGIYYIYDKDGNVVKDKKGWNIIDETLSSQTITPEQLKLAISKQVQSATQRAAEMTKETETINMEDYRKKYNY